MTNHSLGKTVVAVAASAIATLAVAACDSARGRTPISPSAGLTAPDSTNTRPPDNDLIAAIRASTAKYQNIDAAIADGYIDDGFGCIDSTMIGLDGSVGGMGFHMINWTLHNDPATDPLHPDLLVYEPAASEHGKPKLVALEYEVFRPDWWAAGNTQPPSLLGHQFESIDFDVDQIFGLHVWLWRDNPSGLFADFNPKTSCR